MTLHDKCRAICGELSDDYLLVQRSEGSINYATSSSKFAKDILPGLEETISEWVRLTKCRDLKHHHQDRPPKEEADGTAE